jgi:ATP-dependent helicase/nuclease subunit A
MSVPALIEEVLSRRLLRATAYDDWRPREAHRRYRFVAEQARALARSGRSTLHDTVDLLERLARNPKYDSVVVETSPDEHAVRVMTVHAAKGLEFPIVIVTGLGRKPITRRSPIATDHLSGSVELHVGEFATEGREALDVRESAMEAAERVRLLYVALTRARDHLVVGVFAGPTTVTRPMPDGLIRGCERARAWRSWRRGGNRPVLPDIRLRPTG